ncbi:hypothetical protein Tco_1431894 [Tanacetum coccineum]
MEKITIMTNYLNDHKKWKNVKYPKYLSKSTSDSAHIGLNLNGEATDSGDEDVEETRPVGRDKTKRMGSTFAARMRPSAVYLGIKERELEMQD